MKILFFSESLLSGGKERRLVELLKGIQSKPDIECELVLTCKEIHYKDIFHTGIKIHYIIRKHIKKDPRLFYLFFKICKEYKPDIIHVWGNMVAVYALPSKIILHIPMINNQISDAPLHVNSGLLKYKLTFLFSDLIIANSKAGLISYNSPAKKSIVIYNGFDFERIKDLKEKSEIKKQFNIKTNFVIGMVASFSDKKDYRTYIEAANKILNNNKDITFLCVGAGNDSYFRNLVKPKFSENVKFLGRQENVESIMNVCDIGVLSTYTEGISNSVLEFMSLGKPVIANGGGGTKELIINNQTGILFKSKSVEDLLSKILFLYENLNLAHKMGENGKKRIENKFNIKTMVKKFIESYKFYAKN